MIVVIDDERTFNPLYFTKSIIYLRTSQDALLWFTEYSIDINWLPGGAVEEVDEIWFDHDLGSLSKNDALVVAKYVAQLVKFDPSGCLDDTDIYIHSQNPVGAGNIKAVFTGLDLDAHLRELPPCN